MPHFQCAGTVFLALQIQVHLASDFHLLLEHADTYRVLVTLFAACGMESLQAMPKGHDLH